MPPASVMIDDDDLSVISGSGSGDDITTTTFEPTTELTDLNDIQDKLISMTSQPSTSTPFSVQEFDNWLLIGAAVGGAVTLLLVVCALIVCYRRRSSATVNEETPSDKSGHKVPQEVYANSTPPSLTEKPGKSGQSFQAVDSTKRASTPDFNAPPPPISALDSEKESPGTPTPTRKDTPPPNYDDLEFTQPDGRDGEDQYESLQPQQ